MTLCKISEFYISVSYNWGEMVRKERPKTWELFGAELKAARESLGLTAQQIAAELRCHPSSIAHWEAGTDKPKASALAWLSTRYNLDPMGLLHLLFIAPTLKEYHALLRTKEAIEKSDQLWRYIKAGAKHLSNPTELNASDNLRAIASFIDKYEISDREGQLVWERSLKGDLDIFWVVMDHFLDGDGDFYGVVRDNIEAGATYVYFTRDSHFKPGGKFTIFREKLRRDLGIQDLRSKVVEISFTGSEIDRYPFEFVVANPHDDRRIGFQAIRREKEEPPVFNLKMSTDLLLSRISHFEDIAEKKGIPRQLINPRPALD